VGYENLNFLGCECNKAHKNAKLKEKRRFWFLEHAEQKISFWFRVFKHRGWKSNFMLILGYFFQIGPWAPLLSKMGLNSIQH
jgi:hypothetical protein